MKGFFALSALLLVVCLWQSVEGTETGCNAYGKQVAVGENIDHECVRYTCTGPGQMVGKTCPEYRCRKQTGYRENDISKPFPECCGGPICEE